MTAAARDIAGNGTYRIGIVQACHVLSKGKMNGEGWGKRGCVHAAHDKSWVGLLVCRGHMYVLLYNITVCIHYSSRVSFNFNY